MLDAAGVGFEEAALEVQRRLGGTTLDVPEVLLEHLVRTLADVAVLIELIAGLARLKFQLAIEGARGRPGELSTTSRSRVSARRSSMKSGRPGSKSWPGGST